MPARSTILPNALGRDLVAGLVVFLVALPLCLGIALASNTPLFSGIVAGIIGGIVVGALSGSHTSVSGPAAGLTAVVAAQITLLGSFDAFLLSVVIAGAMQVALGITRAGFIAAFFPSSVIKGLLAAIGVILVLKQIPHVLGLDTDPVGDMAFQQIDQHNTLSELALVPFAFHPGAAVIGLLSVALLVCWERIASLKRSNLPAPLAVVVIGVAIQLLFQQFGGGWVIEASHLVQVPVADSLPAFLGFLRMPDFTQWTNPAIYTAALTIAIVASLETLLNLNAVDKLDRQQRTSPPSRELVAQGIGNIASGLVGGLPITSVIVRGSVNVNAGSSSKLSAIFHGVLLFTCVLLLPGYVNLIPLSALAAILLVTGIKLASPKLIKQMWAEGPYQFVPFAVTVGAIVLTDLLVGIVIGFAISIGFILNSNLRRPIRRIVERHFGGTVLHIELANQVSFLNRAALEATLREVPRGGKVLIDATSTDYIDPDILDLLRDFKETIAPAHGVQVSLRGFRDKYRMEDDIQFVDYSTRELQEQLGPAQVLEILREGNERFRTGHRLSRDLGRQLTATADGQHPLAVVVSCIDSRTPAEIIFDLGLGDIFSVRIAGNVVSRKILGSVEYASAVAGAKLILVVGHTRCGAVGAAVELTRIGADPLQTTGCQHLGPIVEEIRHSIDESCHALTSDAEKAAFADNVARRNALHTVQQIAEQSQTIRKLLDEGRVAVLGAVYDVASGKIDFLTDTANGLKPDSVEERSRQPALLSA
ncbi:MAG TPA: SulP family inorganic anion transporter [Terriglobales bacterium]|nr:SulP family inorganic anion transporter [Terriglobales bacterium]